MAVSAVTSTGTSAVSDRAKSFAGDFNTFLKLLTTQLQKQDPLSPMDATAFTSQLVQFASVEQSIQTNAKLTSIATLLQANGTTSALALLGREVTAAGNQVALPDEGDAVIRYRLDKAAAEVALTVLDKNGRTVQRLDGVGSAGENAVNWDGRDASGQRLPAGTYTVTVEAKTADGAVVGADQFIRGTVQALESGDDGMQVLVGGALLPMSAIGHIAEPAAPAAA
jgi:flagellar basal-body rod modification protein FlgD